jgi:uncharacterized protein (DUF1684 family)
MARTTAVFWSVVIAALPLAGWHRLSPERRTAPRESTAGRAQPKESRRGSVTLHGMTASQPHDTTLAEAIAAERAAKDDAFRLSADSPIPAGERESFAGLAYFEVDPSYRLEGLVLGPYEGEEPEAFDMPTSSDDLRRAWRAGTFRFVLRGRSLALVAYDLGGGELFVPFLDSTSGTETYGAGRYLDVEPGIDGSFTLDFNLAYHPYCAYSPQFSCPLTPAENRLAVRIEAGERLPA